MKTHENLNSEKTQLITIETIVHADAKTVWEVWSNPTHIKNWAYASDDWEAPYAENDLRVGGIFKTTMAAKDKSMSFDFGGTYTVVKPLETIDYILGDGRNVFTNFSQQADGIKIVQRFEPESTNPHEMQKGGWQAILDNFKKYTEATNLTKHN